MCANLKPPMVSSTHEHHDYLRKQKFKTPVEREVRDQGRPRRRRPPHPPGPVGRCRCLPPRPAARMWSGTGSRGATAATCLSTPQVRRPASAQVSTLAAATRPASPVLPPSTLSRPAPGKEWRDFVHREDELVVVVSGCMEFTIGGDRCVAHPGDELFIPSGGREGVRGSASGGR